MTSIELLAPVATAREILSLRPLKPLGLDTGMVESLSSFVFRLAALHRVPSRQLAQYVQRGAIAADGQVRTLPTRLDVPSPEAHAFARMLAGLTMQPEVEFLGLGWMHAQWAPNRPLAGSNRWCPECFATMETPYCPLAWSVAGCTTCSKHGCRLVDICQHCAKPRSDWLPARTDHSHCQHCDNPLQREVVASDAPALSKAARPDASALVVELIGNMQSTARERFRPPDFGRLLQEAVQRTRRKTISSVAETAGFSETALQLVTSGRNTPSVDMILRLCVIARVPPGTVFGMREWTSEVSVIDTVSTSMLPQKYRRPTHDWESIRVAMIQAMSPPGKAPTLQEFALRYEVTPRSLRQQFPAMSKSLETLANRRKSEALATAS